MSERGPCPSLALFGRNGSSRRCPFTAVRRTSRSSASKSGNDPQEASACRLAGTAGAADRTSLTSPAPPQPTAGNHAARRSPDRQPTCRTQVDDQDTGSAEGLGDRTNDRRQDRQSAELAGPRLSPETFQNHFRPRLACGSHRRESNHPFHQSESMPEPSPVPEQTCRSDKRRPPRETCSRRTVLLGCARWMTGQACHLAKSRQRRRVAGQRAAGAQGSPKRDRRQSAHRDEDRRRHSSARAARACRSSG